MSRTGLRRQLARALMRRGYPIVTPVLRDIYRTRTLVKSTIRPIANGLRWFVLSKEYTNLTYDISEISKKYLVTFIANVFERTPEEIHGYIREVEEDTELREYFNSRVPTTTDRYFADLPLKYGRRIGWYALVRMLKPRLVIESGIDRGMGTCILAAAILRNTQEGREGKVIGLDINPYAGAYIGGIYQTVIETVYRDSLEYLRSMNHEVDLFIHDSDHSWEHEMGEYESVKGKLTPDGVLVSDNAQASDCLHEFACRNAMRFWYWQEEVLDHIGTPSGIGIAVLDG